MKIHFLGGTSEYGRASYLLLGEKKSLLLDFGVKRIEKNGKIGQYPLIEENLAKKIDTVFLSHAHDDHVSALPLLYKRGYQGAVYGEEKTIPLAKTYIANWMKNVKKKGGKLPYEEKWADKVVFSPLSRGENTIKGIRIKTGRTGHMIGSLWFDFEFCGKKVFYSGDICFESMLFAYDLPDRNFDIAILDASYGTDDTPQKEYKKRLWKAIEKVVDRNGSILFPLPAKGRGVDLMLMLSERYEWLSKKGIKIYVEDTIFDYIKVLKNEREWLKEEGIEKLRNFDPKIFKIIEDKEILAYNFKYKEGPVFILANDAMLSGGSSLYFFNFIKNEEKNGVIFTGYLAPGTPGAEIFTPYGKRKYMVESELFNIKIKAHLGFSELKQLLFRIRPTYTFLVHCDRDICLKTKKALEKYDISAYCMSPGDIWMP